MVDPKTLRSGRTPFDLRATDQDYSGLSISDRYLVNANIEKSFFNGVDLSNCTFAQVHANNVEFNESKIEECYFEGTDFGGSDFVDCSFGKVIFVNCNFEKGEWRDSAFNQCEFRECNFSHTTVALCKFSNCCFDEVSLNSAEHRAIYFNVFTLCKFAHPVRDIVFASRNFGIPARSMRSQLTATTSNVSIEQVCLLNNIGQLRIAVLADVVESICSSLASKSQRRNSTLAFFSKIVRILTDERRISATSLIYLEERITHLATTVDDQDLFMAAMAAVIEIRSAIFSVASESLNRGDASARPVRNIKVRFSPTYARRQAEIFCETLAEAAGVPKTGLNMYDFRSGSTIFEIASTTILSTGTLLTGLNFVLRQATVTVQQLTGLKHAVTSLTTDGLEKTPKSQPTKSAPARMRSILKTGAVVPELAPVRAAVQRTGRTLVEMDEEAEVTILSE